MTKNHLPVWPHVICSQQQKFSRAFLEKKLFPEAKRMREIVKMGGCNVLQGKRGISLFYQSSTRTAGSLASALDLLGGRVVFSTDNAREFSSAAKGESLEHTMKVWNCYRPDIIFLRYDREIGAEIAAGSSIVPIINAGDRQPQGLPKSPYSGQHPTQAFLDVFTILEYFGKIDDISIAMVGDLINGRTVRSLAYDFAKFLRVKLYFVSPFASRMRPDVKNYLKRHGVEFAELTDLREVAGQVNVIYQTRTQTECGSKIDRSDHSKGYFVVDKTITSMMQKDAIIMHPLPIDRSDPATSEIAPEIDEDPRAVYLTKQIEAGLLTRMALLKMILAPKA